MNKENIKKIREISVSEFWGTRERFISWLANNLDVLEKPMEEKLELVDKNKHIEGNTIDIIAKSAKQEKKESFLIFCKLKKLNNNHLDQIRSLQEIKESSRIILLATEFSQKHLNKFAHIESKSSGLHIHPVKLELFKVVKTNIVVPLFRIIEPKKRNLY